MKKIKYAVAAAAAVMCASLVAPGIATASPDAAVMCNTDAAGLELCAQASGSHINMVAPNKASSTFFVPTTDTGTAQIRLSGTDNCLTQENGDTPNIVLDKCQGLARQEWFPRFISGEQFSTYSYQNQYTSDCLNDDYFQKYIDAATCNDGTDELMWFPMFPVM